MAASPLPLARLAPLEPHARELATCTYCPKMCRAGCPVASAEASEAALPTWKGALLHMALEGRVPLAGAVAEAAYRCVDCALAREHCLHRHEPAEPYAIARRIAFEGGAAPATATSFAERCRRLGNPFEEGLAAHLSELAGGERILADGARASAVLFPGCAATMHARGLVRDALAVSEAAEGAPTLCAASGAGCCGYPLHAVGDAEGFRAQARRTAAALEGAREVWALDPGCARTMRELWPEVGVTARFRARTLVERLHERMDVLRPLVREPVPGPTVYHDPCALGRHLGVYEAPRALLALATGGAPLEAPTRRERAACAGGGGPYARIWPESAARIADQRLDELLEAAPVRIASACPSAERRLAQAVSRRRQEGGEAAAGRVEVEDVVTVLARALGLRRKIALKELS